jgi:hypothetical protein
MLLGLGWPEWLTIIGLVGGLVLTFYVMAKASVAYERKRKQREGMAAPGDSPAHEPARRTNGGGVDQ